MGWQDRDYNDGGRRPGMSYTGGPGTHPLLKIFIGALPLGRWFGIHVRIHAMFLWFLAFSLFSAGKLGWPAALANTVMMFVVVLLHEFGHCFGARIVGGRATEILMWPLGGLAFVETERRPWPSFVATVCGPLVNVLICIVTGLWIYFQWGVVAPLNPLFPYVSTVIHNYYSNNPTFAEVYFHPVGGWVFATYSTSFALLFFNLLPIFPFDGGRMAQEILWKFIGYVKSMSIACIVGMVGAVMMGLVGLATTATMLIFLAIFGFLQCYQQRRMLQYEVEANDGLDLSAAWEEPTSPRALKRRHGLWAKRAAKKAAQDQAEQAKIDAILAKVKEKGLHSLTWFEKRALKKATERQRQRDLAER